MGHLVRGLGLTALCLMACDDTLPPVPDADVDAGIDTIAPDVFPEDALPEDQRTDVACTRPDGFCWNDSDCLGRDLICSTSRRECQRDPCCEGGPEECETICAGACIPPGELEAAITKAAAWSGLELLLYVQVTVELANNLPFDVHQPRLVETRLISQVTPTKVEVLKMSAAVEVIPHGTKTSVTFNNLPSPSGSPDPGKAWKCGEKVKIATLVEYLVGTTTTPRRTQELWSPVFDFECGSEP